MSAAPLRLSRLPQGYRPDCLILIRTDSAWSPTVPPNSDIYESTPSVHLKNKTLKGLSLESFRVKAQFKIKVLYILSQASPGCGDVSSRPQLERSVGRLLHFCNENIIGEVVLVCSFSRTNSLGSYNTLHQQKGSFPFIQLVTSNLKQHLEDTVDFKRHQVTKQLHHRLLLISQLAGSSKEIVLTLQVGAASRHWAR